ncbi:MAG: hypothetical protein M1833_006680 [Piccolia ochrophora]|nr:MAG: hypothetical protein M1833_006680 [Piccolia ochrophora]
MPPRRIQVAFTAAIFCVALILFLTHTSSTNPQPAVSDLSNKVSHGIADRLPKPKLSKLPLPSIYNPFRAGVHKPPVQANSTSGEAKWYDDWKWLNPFSSSITLDENRSVLPPLRNRPPIYTFYEPSKPKDKELTEAEHKLLLIWRRAWWAQGFRPVILGRPEAMNNPLYEKVQSLKLDGELETDLARWLAWEHMGSGILANWLALPMAPYGDPLLAFLRRGEYPVLSRYENLGSGFFSGGQSDITTAIKQALDSSELPKAKSVLDVLPKDAMRIDGSHESIAFYDSKTISSKYKEIAEKLTRSSADAYKMLALLINAHLQIIFQNAFSKGVLVVRPDLHMTALLEPAMQIANSLVACAESPLPASCPPNRLDCKPCVSSQSFSVSTLPVYRNSSSLYTIGSVPHPYTVASLVSQRQSLDTAYIRRKSTRDPWISAVTKEFLGTAIGASARLSKFKEAVASEWGTAHSLWLVAEKEMPADLDWHFGFAIPHNGTDRGLATPPVPGTQTSKPDPKRKDKEPTEKELQQEKILVNKASSVVRSPGRQAQPIRDIAEAWNLADTEAWRFTRAFSARSRVERLKWLEEEKNFAGGTDEEP